MTMLALAPPRIAISSFNLRRLTLGLPIAIGPPNPSPHRPLPKEAVNARRPRTAAAEIPIASDAPPRHTSRGFLPWRFAYAGPGVRRATIMGASIRKPSQKRSPTAPGNRTSSTGHSRGACPRGSQKGRSRSRQMAPVVGGSGRLWWARPVIANLSRPPFLTSDRKTAASRQTSRLNFPDQF